MCMDTVFRKCAANCGKFILGDMNARIGSKLVGEDHVVGEHTFGRAAIHQVEVPNRDLLMEFCQGAGLLVVNIPIDKEDAKKVTFMEAGARLLGAIAADKFNVLDVVLCEPADMSMVLDICSVREAALATDHFLVQCSLEIFKFQATSQQERKPKCKQALADLSHKQAFTDTFC